MIKKRRLCGCALFFCVAFNAQVDFANERRNIRGGINSFSIELESYKLREEIQENY